jgi:dTDP-4-dehydrorhamnose reductase
VLIGVSTIITVARIIVVGSGGRLGGALLRQYRKKFDVIGFNHIDLDLANFSEFRVKLGDLNFDIIINAAALTNVDLCEKERQLAFLINAEAPRLLAEIAREKDAKLIHFSTDYVFDGEKREPYTEEDPARPISVYGESKRAGEENVLSVDANHLVVRVAWVFGPDRPSFVDGIIARAREQEQIAAVADKFSTPTYTVDIAAMLRPIISVAGTAGSGAAAMSNTGYRGILHFANAGGCSWQQYAQHAIDCCHQFGVRLKARKVAAIQLTDMTNFVARRPRYTVLSTAKYAALTTRVPRPWREAVTEYVREFIAR